MRMRSSDTFLEDVSSGESKREIRCRELECAIETIVSRWFPWDVGVWNSKDARSHPTLVVSFILHQSRSENRVFLISAQIRPVGIKQWWETSCKMTLTNHHFVTWIKVSHKEKKIFKISPAQPERENPGCHERDSHLGTVHCWTRPVWVDEFDGICWYSMKTRGIAGVGISEFGQPVTATLRQHIICLKGYGVQVHVLNLGQQSKIKCYYNFRNSPLP
jgi:hypothetical protein